MQRQAWAGEIQTRLKDVQAKIKDAPARTRDAVERAERWIRHLPRRAIYVGVALICLIALLGAGLIHDVIASKTTLTTGASPWINDTTKTAPSFSISIPDSTQTPTVASQFQRYYTAHHGEQTLGTPITAAFPVSQGWVQFFVSGALLFPDAQASSNSGGDLSVLMKDGLVDTATGVVLLPLVQSLLTVGSQVQIGGASSALTYVDLRKAAQPSAMQITPDVKTKAGDAQQTAQGDVFVQGGTRNGQPVGHLIPAALWQYINQPDVSPDGWEQDVGKPLTEAIPFTENVQGQTHHLLVQVFSRQALLVDLGVDGSSAEPVIQPAQSGLDYLRTLGPPAVVVPDKQQTIWAQGDTALLNAPESGAAVAHVGQQFPLKLLGDSAWKDGTLWYHVEWSVPKNTGEGWASALGTTFDAPGSAPAWASFDVLSPDLAAYLDSVGENVDAVVYDETRGQYYTYNVASQFIMGSSIKVPIMLTFLDMTESQGREPNAEEMNLLTTMITISDNDSAGILYYNREGGAPAVTNYLQSIGITDMHPNCCAFGYSVSTPLAMVQLLTMLHDGKLLTAYDRNMALSLMSQIVSDQRVGVGDSVPDGADWYMKDGWLQAEGPRGPETGPWAMNSSGIVTMGGETYIIAVDTQGQDTLADGQAIVQHVCDIVADMLL